MGDFLGKTERSNAVETAGLRAELGMLFQAVRRLAPGLSLPSNPQHSVSHTITPPVDLNPAYSNSPSTLALVLRYFRYNVYAPLFYLALVKKRVDDEEGDDDDDRKHATMVAPELADGSPSLLGDMSAAELLEEIRTGQGLLLKVLRKRKSELEEELTSIKKWRRVSSEANSLLSIALVVINLTALVAVMVSIAEVPLVSVAVVNLLGAAAMKGADSWLGMTDDEQKSKLESQADAIKAMRRGSSSALLLLLPNLEQIRSLLENLKIERAGLRAVGIKQHTLAADDQADQGDVGQTAAAAAAHLDREVEEKKKKVKKAIKGVRKMVDRVEREVKEEAADFVNIIIE